MPSPVMRSISTALCLFLLVVIAPLAAAQTFPDLDGQPRLLGFCEGDTHLAAVPIGKNLIAAVTTDSLLVVYHQQWNDAPVLVGSVPMHGDYRWLANHGKFVYVAGDLGVKVFKINKDGRIQFKGELEGTEGTGEIKADGDLLAMVHEGAWSLWDCEDRATPVQLAHTAFETNSYNYRASKIALGGNRVAIDGTVFDISEPMAPVVAGQMPSDNSSIAACEIVGDRLYEFRTTSDGGGSWIYGDRWYYRTYYVYVRDLNDTQSFAILANYYFQHSTSPPMQAPKPVFAKNGNYLMAGQTADRNILVIDTTAPVDSEPLWIPAAPNSVLVHQDEQLVGLGSGLWAYAVPSTSQPGRVSVAAAGVGGSGYGTGYTYYSVEDVAVADDLVAVVEETMVSDGRHYWDEWYSVRLYQPGTGSLAAVASVETWYSRIALIDGYLLSGAGKLYASDISDLATPGDPVLVPGVEGVNDLVALDGQTVAVGDRDGGFTIYDLADPAAPVLLGSCNLGDRVGIMARDGNTVLVTLPWSDEIVVVDVSDHGAPQVCAAFEVLGTVSSIAGRHGHGLAISNDYTTNYQIEFDYPRPGKGPQAYSNGVRDLSGPVTTMEIPLFINGLSAHGQYIFGSGSGLHSYNPASRSHIGSVATSYSYLGVASCENRLYAVCYNELIDLTGVTGDVAADDGMRTVAHVEIPGVGFALTAAPNPFNPMTQFSFTLAREEFIHLAVFDLKGRQVRELASGIWLANHYTVNWNGQDSHGREMPSGVYFVKLRAGQDSAVAKVMLVR